MVPIRRGEVANPVCVGIIRSRRLTRLDPVVPRHGEWICPARYTHWFGVDSVHTGCVCILDMHPLQLCRPLIVTESRHLCRKACNLLSYTGKLGIKPTIPVDGSEQQPMKMRPTLTPVG